MPIAASYTKYIFQRYNKSFHTPDSIQHCETESYAGNNESDLYVNNYFQELEVKLSQQ